MKIIYINLDRRPDRDKRFREHAESFGFEVERRHATESSEACGWRSCAERGIFYDHVCLWERVAIERKLYIIAEDDTVITNIERVRSAIEQVQKKPDWHCLYFYRPSWMQETQGMMERCGDVASNFYMPNPESAHLIAKELRAAYDRYSISGPKCCEIVIDHFMRINIWNRYVAYGIENVACQGDFGSDTGWRNL